MIGGIVRMVAFVAGLVFAQDSPPEYVCHKAAGPVVVDGRLDEAAWQRVEGIGEFVVFNPPPDTATCRTEAKLLWDDGYFYIGFACEDPDVWATLTERDLPLYPEEAVEAFIDPDGDALNYIELQVNAINNVRDIMVEDIYGEKDFANWGRWNIEGLRTGIYVDGTLNDASDLDSGWSVEIAIPWEGFGPAVERIHVPPKTGDVWRINLYRYERIGRSDRPELIGWSYTGKPSFHVPERFGIIRFSEKAPTPVEGRNWGQVKKDR